ncbi:MAG TPA: RdgB/HAM1 family non-canonical purine NTP pyrophosphatase [Bacillota bacterium]|jgi:XTP/dITP diphosphohydrolase|nr:RdgB/HAM1 family non-canonical purine NTP pyrophosphatase [Fastidiosipila sp.]HPX93895.1 RdgB/HAM1 family non-canonical purine NTP pyrophosphatase [Bacillota bacterium]HQB81791.1 RdgB/HAM1 family non-canonical purine NTP pyrophosphatase [Bacillota bacterium]
MTIIAVASHNQGKLEELKAMAKGWPVRLIGPDELGLVLEADENGHSFDENALIKCRALHEKAGGWVMADDSGLVVDYLGGDPGIHSARYAGSGATDQENCRLLLDRLKEAGEGERRAHFHCSLAVISPGGQTELYHGRTGGTIAYEARGSGGFGYDPVFIPDNRQGTLAELPPDEKNAISHRGQAFRLFLDQQFGRPADEERTQ